MSPRHKLTRAIVRLILLAAVLSAPIFLFAESFDREHTILVLGSNGVCAVLCLALLRLLKKDRVDICARTLVFGLFALVGFLASTNGEDVHINVVNFVLITVLTSVLLGRRALVAVSGLSALTMMVIAWRQAVPHGDEGIFVVRLESIAQFLLTYLVVVTILWLREGPAVDDVAQPAAVGLGTTSR